MSDLFLAGPFNPQFLDPLQTYGVAQDFVVGVPVVASPGQGNCTMMIEAQGYQMKTDGTADAVPFVGWHTVGNFTDTGIENLPEWHLSQPSDLSLIPSDNVGFGIQIQPHPGALFSRKGLSKSRRPPGDGVLVVIPRQRTLGCMDQFNGRIEIREAL